MVRRQWIIKSPSFAWPAGRPCPDQAGAKKAGEPAGRGLWWTASHRAGQAEARTGRTVETPDAVTVVVKRVVEKEVVVVVEVGRRPWPPCTSWARFFPNMLSAMCRSRVLFCKKNPFERI